MRGMQGGGPSSSDEIHRFDMAAFSYTIESQEKKKKTS